MKSVSGKVTSTKPISLSKASKILSCFVSSEYGASQATSVYLRRASPAFMELLEFHKELRVSHSSHKRRNHIPGYLKNEYPLGMRYDFQESQAPYRHGHKKEYLAKSEHDVQDAKGDSRKQKKQGNEEALSVPLKIEPKNEQVEGEKVEDVVVGVREGNNKNRKKKNDCLENDGGARVTIEEERRERKKRKSLEVDYGEIVDSREQSGWKNSKKRRRTG